MIAENYIPMAILRMSECMTYFPQSAVFKVELAKTITALIGGKTLLSKGVQWTPEMRLEWLTDVMVQAVGKWPDDGLREVRAIYCERFPPADGHDLAGTAITPGFRDQDTEGCTRSPFLSAGAKIDPRAQIPGPGDEPIGEGLMKQIEEAAKKKRIA